MKRVDYNDLYLGNVVIFRVLPTIKYSKSRYTLVTGIVGTVNNYGIRIANGADIRSSLDHELIYSKRNTDTMNIRLVRDSLSDKILCFDDIPKLGDLLLMNMKNNNYYVGFVNEMSVQNLLLTNYHPGHRRPWIQKNHLLVPLSVEKADHSYAKLVTNEDIENYFSHYLI